MNFPTDLSAFINGCSDFHFSKGREAAASIGLAVGEFIAAIFREFETLYSLFLLIFNLLRNLL